MPGVGAVPTGAAGPSRTRRPSAQAARPPLRLVGGWPCPGCHFTRGPNLYVALHGRVMKNSRAIVTVLVSFQPGEMSSHKMRVIKFR